MARGGREALPKGQEVSGGLPEGLGGIWRPIRRAVRSWGDLSEGQEGSGGYPRGPGGIWRLCSGPEEFERDGRGLKALSKGCERTGGPLVGPRGVRRPSWRVGRQK